MKYSVLKKRWAWWAYSPLAAAFVGDITISFCVAVETEGLCDISIDTLTGYRRRGHAVCCVYDPAPAPAGQGAGVGSPGVERSLRKAGGEARFRAGGAGSKLSP